MLLMHSTADSALVQPGVFQNGGECPREARRRTSSVLFTDSLMRRCFPETWRLDETGIALSPPGESW